MDKTLGKEYKDAQQRMQFLKDNCDQCEEKGYMKPFNKEQLQGYKESLANISIEIAEVEEEAKISSSFFKEKLKPLKEQCKELLMSIKQKAEYVHEVCYRFTDQETKTTAYYNAEGDLIEERPATADEMQSTVFSIMRGTGTDDNL